MFPDPAVAPLTPAGEFTDQENPVPATEDVMRRLVCCPEQMVSISGAIAISGVGFTVMAYVAGTPGQMVPVVLAIAV